MKRRLEGSTKTGDDAAMTLTVKIAGQVADLTAYQEITFKARDPKSSLEIVKTLSGGEITLLTQAGDTMGQAVIVIDQADTEQWTDISDKRRELVIEVEVINATGKKKTPIWDLKWVLDNDNI